MSASEQGFVEIVKLLLQAGVYVDSDDVKNMNNYLDLF
jgi:hypothetical protein